jgi:hypothetical protein
LSKLNDIIYLFKKRYEQNKKIKIDLNGDD